MIPAAFIHDLLSRTDIVEIVGRHVQLKKGGANLMGLCPFHGEKSPSFSVSPSKQFYHCFGCGASGDAIKFLTEFGLMSFVDAVHELAQRAGMTVPEEDSTPAERAQAALQKQRRATLSDVLVRAADHYRKQLKASPRAVDYLKGRGLNGEIAARFGLGYAPEGWRGLASVFPDYDDPLLEESGLVIAHGGAPRPTQASSAPQGGSSKVAEPHLLESAPRPTQASSAPQGGSSKVAEPHLLESAPRPTQASSAPQGGSSKVAEPHLLDDGAVDSNKKRYDRFRDRIMFPIRSVQGEVVGFGGRVLDRGEPKYLNSPETPVFSKGRELYGLFEARAGLRDRGYALVVEGYMDVVALAQSGFGNAVATLGTACTAEHVQKLFRFTDSVVFSFDGDVAGQRAASRALQASLPHATDTRTVRFLFLPFEHDPDSYVRERGAAAFEDLLAQAVPLSRQVGEVASLGQDLQTAEGRAHMLANAKPLWSALPDGALKRQLLGDLATLGRLESAELHSMWGGTAPARESTATRLPPRRAQRVSKGAANLLDRAIWLLLHRCEMWAALDGESHDMLAAQAAPYDLFFGCIERSLHEHGPIGAQALLAELQARAQAEGGAAAVISRIAQFHDPEPKVELAAELALVIDKLRLQAVEDELTLLFASGGLSPDAQQRSRHLSAERSRLKAEFARRPSI